MDKAVGTAYYCCCCHRYRCCFRCCCCRRHRRCCGKFHLCQSPKPYPGMVAAFCELCAKIILIQDRHGLRHQELYNGSCARPVGGGGV